MPKNPTFFAGEYRAVSYAYGIVATIPGLIVDNPTGATASGAQTLAVAFGNYHAAGRNCHRAFEHQRSCHGWDWSGR